MIVRHCKICSGKGYTDPANEGYRHTLVEMPMELCEACKGTGHIVEGGD